MLFRTPEDRYLFLSEIGENSQSEDKPDHDSLFVKKRARMVSLLKDFSKSSAGKRNWGTHRQKLLGALQKYHRSLAGRKQHRQQGRFLASKRPPARSGLFAESLASIRKQALDELRYYNSAIIQAELELLVEVCDDILADE